MALDNSDSSKRRIVSHLPGLDRLGLGKLELMMPKVRLAVFFASKPGRYRDWVWRENLKLPVGSEVEPQPLLDSLHKDL